MGTEGGCPRHRSIERIPSRTSCSSGQTKDQTADRVWQDCRLGAGIFSTPGSQNFPAPKNVSICQDSSGSVRIECQYLSECACICGYVEGGGFAIFCIVITLSVSICRASQTILRLRVLPKLFVPGGWSRLLSVGCVLAAPWGAAPVRAQSGSAPVGVMSYAVAENSTISLGVPLLRPGVTVAGVGAVAGATLTLTGTAAGVAVPLAEGESYFVEVVAHVDGTTTALVGHRFEVDEAATSAGAGGTVVLEPASPYNTAPATTIAGLVNYRVAVRPHWTLAALLGTGGTAKMNAAVTVGAADQVLAWNGSGFSVYYLRAGEVPQWRNIATGPLNQDGAILAPGVGLYLRRRAGGLNFSVLGEVRVNAFVRPVFGASQLVAGGFPVDSSPADWQLATGPGLTAGTSPANSDQLLSWAANAFSLYYLRTGAVPEWRNVATGLIDQTNVRFFPAQGATLLLLRAAAAGAVPTPLVQAVPFSL